jgi:hypothetical protein
VLLAEAAVPERRNGEDRLDQHVGDLQLRELLLEPREQLLLGLLRLLPLGLVSH